jgi:hypothetical protein
MAQFYQEASTFTGTGLLMNLGAGTGVFSGNFLDLQSNGNSRFKVTSSGTTTIGQLNQTATSAGLIIGYGGLCVDNDGYCFASTTGRVSAVSYTTGSTDLAENYFSSTTLDVGDIVMSAGGETITRGVSTSSQHVIGIVSTKPGIILGLDEHTPLSGEYPVALAGRVPVNVSLVGGAIKKGDRITLSRVPGIGMKANATSSVTVGIALDDWSGDASILDTAQTGKVLAFVSLAYTDLNKHISGTQINLTAISTGELVSLFGLSSDTTEVRYLANRPLNFSEATLNNVKAIFSANGKWSLSEDGKLTVEEVNAKTVRASERLFVGTPTNRTGVTLYDETDGSPYCIKMVATVLKSIQGTCDNPIGATPPASGSTPPPPPPPPSPAPESPPESPPTDDPVLDNESGSSTPPTDSGLGSGSGSDTPPVEPDEGGGTESTPPPPPVSGDDEGETPPP